MVCGATALAWAQPTAKVPKRFSGGLAAVETPDGRGYRLLGLPPDGNDCCTSVNGLLRQEELTDYPV